MTTISAPPYFTPLDRLLSVKHIELATQRVTIQAPKALCFEVIAAAGETVQKRSDTERVVDFDLEHKGQLIKTRELLNLRPPDAIDYRWLDGPLPFVEETISFEARGDRTTDMIYEGSFSLGSGWRNWLVGALSSSAASTASLWNTSRRAGRSPRREPLGAVSTEWSAKRRCCGGAPRPSCATCAGR